MSQASPDYRAQDDSVITPAVFIEGLFCARYDNNSNSNNSKHNHSATPTVTVAAAATEAEVSLCTRQGNVAISVFPMRGVR